MSLQVSLYYKCRVERSRPSIRQQWWSGSVRRFGCGDPTGTRLSRSGPSPVRVGLLHVWTRWSCPTAQWRCMTSLISSRQIAGQPIPRASRWASVVLPAPAAWNAKEDLLNLLATARTHANREQVVTAPLDQFYRRCGLPRLGRFNRIQGQQSRLEFSLNLGRGRKRSLASRGLDVHIERRWPRQPRPI
jgi:hypothetical protein